MTQFQAIILAGGKGTRMHSQLPKPLHKLCGRTILERVVRAVCANKPSKVIVVVGHGETILREEISKIASQSFANGITFEVVRQIEQLGSGDAVKTGLAKVDSTLGRVLIIPSDMPLVSEELLTEIFLADDEIEKPELLVISAILEDPYSYGRIVRDKEGRVQEVIEEKDATEEVQQIREVNTSLYLANADFLNEAVHSLNANNAQQELLFTDVVKYGVAKGYRVEALPVSDEIEVTGVNSREELMILTLYRREEIMQDLMEKGVTFEDPRATYIDEDVIVEEDVFIGAGTRLRGRTIIKRGVVIDGDSIIEDSIVASGTHVKLGSVIESSAVGENCLVGPYAHLRPGSYIHNNVHIGNFVETKKTEIFDGAKANHLTYLGDASIGARTNIGCGTITCNYDGKNKHKTTIGEDVFIGSDTSLIAPVSVGNNAFVGAGSVITKDVPNEALALTRPELRIVPEFAKRKK